LQVSFSTRTQLYSVQYSSKQYRELQAWEYPCGPLWLSISGHVIQFQYSVAYSAPVECKHGNNTGIIGNFERIIGSFWGNKRIE